MAANQSSLVGLRPVPVFGLVSCRNKRGQRSDLRTDSSKIEGLPTGRVYFAEQLDPIGTRGCAHGCFQLAVCHDTRPSVNSRRRDCDHRSSVMRRRADRWR